MARPSPGLRPAIVVSFNARAHALSMRKTFLASVLLIGSTLTAIAAPTQCPAFFAGGVAPDVGPALSQKVRPLCFSAYALLHSGVTRSALWSAEHLTRDNVRSARSLERQNLFHAESDLPASERAELSDYVRSGFDRGHLAPSGNMPDEAAQAESFSLANMIPQDPDNNRNLWASIETAVRDHAVRSGELYVVTGPLYIGKDLKVLRGRVLVPTHVFKAVYDPRRQAAAAYITANGPGAEWKTVSIKELEGLAGIDVFPALSSAAKTKLASLPSPTQRASRAAQQEGWVSWTLRRLW